MARSRCRRPPAWACGWTRVRSSASPLHNSRIEPAASRGVCMRQDVIKRQVQAMQEHGWDAILACSPENFAYVTGFMSPTQPLMRWRHAMALVTADGASSLLVIDMEASTIRA